ncbi:MAG TPA: transglycosylase SLT domain-containing protein [Limnochordales bacterium]
MRWRIALIALLCTGLVLMPVGETLACSAYDDLIRPAAERHGVPSWLVKGLIAAESGFRADAYRPEPRVNDAAHGLMQVLLSTARDMGYRGSASELMDPATNIEWGTRYLARMWNQFGRDPQLAVAAYNAGPGTVGRLVDRYGQSYEAIRPHLRTGTQDHVARTMNYATQFRDAARQGTVFACPAGTPPTTNRGPQPLAVLLIFAAVWLLASQ